VGDSSHLAKAQDNFLRFRLRRLQLPEQVAYAPGDAAALTAQLDNHSKRVWDMHTDLKQVQLDDSVAGNLRCDCGKLLARVLHAVLELKCPRCKRSVLVAGGRRYEPAGGGHCACGEEPSNPLVGLPRD
jgi:hypothetical protein